MKNYEFEQIFRDQVAACEKTLLRKGSEYATEDDRLHNFRVAGTLQGETTIQALGGMLAKHIVSIFDLIQQNKPINMDIWDEKIGDAMNYLFLLKALVLESQPHFDY